MKHRFFLIPAKYPEQSEQALNAFYASHAVISIEKQFVADGANSFWSICISYHDNEQRLSALHASANKGKIDYKDVLNEEDFSIYAQCRELRKTLAERDGVPVYAVFTNEQLANMVQQRIDSKQGLLSLSGVGQTRVDKYGEAFLNLLTSQFNQSHETQAHQSS